MLHYFTNNASGTQEEQLLYFRVPLIESVSIALSHSTYHAFKQCYAKLPDAALLEVAANRF